MAADVSASGTSAFGTTADKSADKPAAEDSSEAQPGTNAAGTSLRQGYVGQASASTLVAEPVVEPEVESPAPSASTTQQLTAKAVLPYE